MSWDETLSRYCFQIKHALDPESIILHGSRAKLQQLETSDYDLVVISRRFTQRFLDRLLILDKLRVPGDRIQAVGYTPSEFSKMVESGNPFAREVMLHGIPLLDNGFFRKLRSRFEANLE